MNFHLEEGSQRYKDSYDWGLEIGVLSEMFRNYAGNRLCQVDIADNYDHKHQDIFFDDNSKVSQRCL